MNVNSDLKIKVFGFNEIVFKTDIYLKQIAFEFYMCR